MYTFTVDTKEKTVRKRTRLRGEFLKKERQSAGYTWAWTSHLGVGAGRVGGVASAVA